MNNYLKEVINELSDNENDRSFIRYSLINEKVIMVDHI